MSFISNLTFIDLWFIAIAFTLIRLGFSIDKHFGYLDTKIESFFEETIEKIENLETKMGQIETTVELIYEPISQKEIEKMKCELGINDN